MHGRRSRRQDARRQRHARRRVARDDWHDDDPQDAGDSRPHRGHRRDRLTPEERLYRDARARANSRLRWWAHAASYAGVLAIILVSTRSIRVVMIVAIAWGLGLGLHYLFAMLAPSLRQRWIDQEVGRQVDHGVSRLDAAEHENARSLENLSASIAHEIRNPVTAAKSLVQQMGEDPVSEDNIEYAKVALDELDRVERSISHLLRYAREQDFDFEDVSIPDLIDSSIAALSERADRFGIVLEQDITARCALRGDAEKLRRVFMNLLSNAFDALADAAVADPVVRISAGENLAGSEVWIRFRDNGPGIDAGAGQRIFDPFYTTKTEGTGLGLALSRKVIEAHGGTLEARGRDEGGAEFLITIPKSLAGQEVPT